MVFETDFGRLVIFMKYFWRGMIIIRLIICIRLNMYERGCLWFWIVLVKALGYPLPKLNCK